MRGSSRRGARAWCGREALDGTRERAGVSAGGPPGSQIAERGESRRRIVRLDCSTSATAVMFSRSALGGPSLVDLPVRKE
jgi:hypothetical protein